MFAVMVVYSGVLLAFGGRNETVGVLGGRPADERLASFNILATAFAGIAAIVVAIGGFLWAIATPPVSEHALLRDAAGALRPRFP